MYHLCYATELGSVPRLAAKPICGHQVVVMAFREGVLKATFKGEGCKRYDFLLTGWWRGNRVMFGNLNRQLSGSSQSGVYVLWSAYDHHPLPGQRS